AGPGGARPDGGLGGLLGRGGGGLRLGGRGGRLRLDRGQRLGDLGEGFGLLGEAGRGGGGFGLLPRPGVLRLLGQVRGRLGDLLGGLVLLTRFRIRPAQGRRCGGEPERRGRGLLLARGRGPLGAGQGERLRLGGGAADLRGGQRGRGGADALRAGA